jgi:hypothetical protein
MGLKVQKGFEGNECYWVIRNVVFVVRPRNEDNDDHSEEEWDWKEGVHGLGIVVSWGNVVLVVENEAILLIRVKL